jgi:hypothetical protein
MLTAILLAAAVHAAPAPKPPASPVVLRTPQGYIAVGFPPCGTEEAKKTASCTAFAVVACPAPDDLKKNTWSLPILPLGCPVVQREIK